MVQSVCNANVSFRGYFCPWKRQKTPLKWWDQGDKSLSSEKGHVGDALALSRHPALIKWTARLARLADVLVSRGLIPMVSCLSCGAVLFIPVSLVSPSPARVLQLNLPPLSLPPTPPRKHILPASGPTSAPSSHTEERRGEEKEEEQTMTRVASLELEDS